MKLTVLGSGVAVPNGCRAPSAYLLEAAGRHLLLDCGAATLLRLEEAGADHLQIDDVLLSHFHPDHCAGLVPLLFAYFCPDHSRTKPLRIAGAPGLSALLANLRRVWGEWLVPRGFDLEVMEVRRHAFSLGALDVRVAMGTHAASSLAYRITDPDGRVLVYSGDTPYSETVVRLAREADLLVLECSFPGGVNAPGHLNAHEAGRMARRAGARTLLLSHFYPACDLIDVRRQAGEIFKGEIRLARDRMELRV
jgi:ribonuclease BN (tRNA processing enzyme)